MRVSEVQDDMREEYLSKIENLDNMRNLHAVKYGRLKKSNGAVCVDLKAATEEGTVFYFSVLSGGKHIKDRNSHTSAFCLV